MGITRFENIEMLWFLSALLPMIAYYIYRLDDDKATIRMSSVKGVEKVPRGLKYYLRHLPFVLRCVAVALLAVALARPQSTDSRSTSSTEGIDIVLSLDISGSMLARDFTPDRMEAAKEMAAKFIMERPNDRIGLVIFAGESFTQCPLTTDKTALVNLLGEVKPGIIEDGTAIGNGLATAVNRLRESDAASKVIILLTDGVNNSGQIAPVTAAALAETFGIKVYTIGVGSQGTAPYPTIDIWGQIAYTPMKVEIDEKVLQEIADKTGGRYFRATDNKSLEAVYGEINELEKSKIEVENYTRYNELFISFALAAFILLLLEAAIRYLYLKRIP